MNIQPLNDRIMVRRDAAETVSKGGIIIPENAKEQPRMGTIVTVGTGKVLDDGQILALGVKEGQRVLFAQHAGVELKVDGSDFIMLRMEDLLGLIDDDAFQDAGAQAIVQLGGCLLAAEGGARGDHDAKPGMYGWSPAFEATRTLRRAAESMAERLGVSLADEVKRHHRSH